MLGMIPRLPASRPGQAEQALAHPAALTAHTWFILNISRAPQGNTARRLYTAGVWLCGYRYMKMYTHCST